MRTIIRALLLLSWPLILSAGCQVSRSRPEIETTHEVPATAPGADVDLTLFYRELAPLGTWVSHDHLGPVWYPNETSAAWKPYVNGRWVAVKLDGDRADWLWAGSDKHAWATHHYGRWHFLDSHGWVWSPDRTWTPANVQWRHGGGYIGWAPRSEEAEEPPAATQPGDETVDAIAATTIAAATMPATTTTMPATLLAPPEISPSAFTFVKEQSLLDEKIREQAEPVTRNVTLLERTKIARPQEIAEAVGEKFQPRKLVELSIARIADVREDEIAIYRPEIGPRPASPPSMPNLTRDPVPLAAEEQRQRQAEYFDQLRFMMQERHERELAEADGDPPAETLARQKREREALADIRQREVEALRRRQREAREIYAAQEAQARLTREKNPPPPKKPQLIPIPKEWELPPGMMRRD